MIDFFELINNNVQNCEGQNHVFYSVFDMIIAKLPIHALQWQNSELIKKGGLACDYLFASLPCVGPNNKENILLTLNFGKWKTWKGNQRKTFWQ